ncbi:Maf family protein [Patescibacteria group bacterium]
MSRKIVLASKSPRRKELLDQIGLKFTIEESKCQEDMKAYANPYRLVKYLALEKAKDIAKHQKDAIVIGADTVVVYNNKILGKPKNKKEAKDMLSRLSGKEHKVISGFAIIDCKNKKIINNYGQAVVKFNKLTQKEIDNYISTGESLDKAGAYGIQGMGAVLINNIRGDYYAVVGLPINKIHQVLRKMSIIR